MQVTLAHVLLIVEVLMGGLCKFFRSDEPPKRGVYAPQDIYTFPGTRLGMAHTLKVNFRNNSFDTHEVSSLTHLG